MLIQNKNIKLILNYVAGPLVFCVLLYSMYGQLHKQADWQTSIHHLFAILNTHSAIQLLMVVLLMLVNWGIEAKKWQLALRPIADISFNHSYKAIFSGTTLAFFTPNRTGEYFGRMVHLEEKNRISSIPPTIVCSVAQLIITLVAGCCGIFLLTGRLNTMYVGYPNIIFWIKILLYVSVITSIVLTIFYFRLPAMVKWLDRVRWIARWREHILVLEGFNATILLRILSLSGGRYLVFIAQYYLLFRVFGVNIDWWQAFWSVSVVFLVIAAIPGIGFLTELGVRWQASLQLLQLFSSNIAGIFATSLAIWMINMVVPALIGCLLILGLKIFRK